MSKVRCPSCGGLNPTGAKWCGQCHARFEPVGRPPPPPPAADSAAVSQSSPSDVAPPPAAVTTDEPHPTSGQETTRPGFTVADGAVRWVCARCEADNDVNDAVCSVCGASFAETVRASEPQASPRDAGTAALWSLVLPGAGHAYAGNWGQAVARGVLSLWVLAMTLLAAVQGRSGAVNTFSILFGLVAFGLWVLGSHDAYREARREPENAILKGRMFLYVVFGLLGLLVILVMSSVNQAATV